MKKSDIERVVNVLNTIKKSTEEAFDFIERILTDTESLYSFSEFWEAWKFSGGRKINYIECKVFYEKLDDPTREKIFSALLNQREERRLKKKHGAPFIADIKHPKTWLRRKSWLDEISTEQEIIDEIDAKHTIKATTRQQQSIDASWDNS